MDKTLEEIMSITEIGETIVLKETEINTYVRKKTGLEMISSKPVEITRLNNPHHQCQ